MAALLLGLVSTVLAVGSAHASAGCKVTYSTNEWSNGFTANMTVTNLGDDHRLIAAPGEEACHQIAGTHAADETRRPRGRYRGPQIELRLV